MNVNKVIILVLKVFKNIFSYNFNIKVCISLCVDLENLFEGRVGFKDSFIYWRGGKRFIFGNFMLDIF